MRSYDCSGIKDGITSYLYVISEHSAELTKSCLIRSSLTLNNNILTVSLDIGCDGTGTEVSLISENGITNVVIVRNLNLVKEDNVLKLCGVTNCSTFADNSALSDECTLSYLSTLPYDSRTMDISRRKDLSIFCNPYILSYLVVLIRT